MNRPHGSVVRQHSALIGVQHEGSSELMHPPPSHRKVSDGVQTMTNSTRRLVFDPVAPGSSGLVVPGDSRSATAVPLRDGAVNVVVARSNGPLLVFATERKPR